MRLNQKCPVCGKLHGNTDKYCSIKCAFDDSNAVNCTQGMDVMMYCTDSKCPYHNAVKEKELERPTLEQQLTAAQAEIARLKAKLEKCKEQRNIEINTGLLLIEWKFKNEEERLKEYAKECANYDQELDSITAESITEESK